MTEPLLWPAHACEAWCRDGDGHEREHPGDRICMTPYEQVPLSRRDPVKMDDGRWWVDHIDVLLMKRDREELTVVIGYEGTEAADREIRRDDFELEFTLDEAQHLYAVLGTLLARALPD